MLSIVQVTGVLHSEKCYYKNDREKLFDNVSHTRKVDATHIIQYITPTVLWCTVCYEQVVQYIAYVDCYDYQDGHGTHVAGSAAGAISGTSPGEHIGDGVGHE